MIQVWEPGFRFWFGIKVWDSGLVSNFNSCSGFRFGIQVWDSSLGLRFGIQVLYSDGGFRVKIQVRD